jgi:cytoskeletal protein CcmA (bactofilin family)
MVTGNIHYGEIELERGGRIAGELKVREGAASARQGDQARATKAA